MNGDKPCLGCERRQVGCHGKCEDYKAYRAKLDEKAALERADAEVYEYFRLRRARKCALDAKRAIRDERGGRRG